MRIQKTNSPIWSFPGLCIRPSTVLNIRKRYFQFLKKKFDFYLFADGTNMLFADKNLKSWRRPLTENLNYFVNGWMQIN